jgi:hypothetical protein
VSFRKESHGHVRMLSKVKREEGAYQRELLKVENHDSRRLDSWRRYWMQIKGERC